MRGQPKGRYESIGLVVFLCILLVVTIVNIMDFSGYLITLSRTYDCEAGETVAARSVGKPTE